MLNKLYSWLVVSYSGKKKISDKIFLFILQISAIAVVALSALAILSIFAS